ncbi:RHS repeat domain-containing protein [Acinetobacter shaoyimingii]|uniref:RHS repeat domain-containing protein n=1 Tax=Acinetobacter shaoyimingii TaxID=2715164 RepID=UPI0029FEFB64|nr:RHS repeat-associated core domain-containing protein [Acinetobacter shaoyimingii]
MYWYQNDHLGTPRELTSNAGNIEWEAVYQAWGNTVTVEWQEVAKAQDFEAIELNELEKAYLLQPHRFQGQIYDVETGLNYNGFRYYDGDSGRFISHDPIRLLGGFNNYLYAPNPILWVDPWGLARSKKLLQENYSKIGKVIQDKSIRILIYTMVFLKNLQVDSWI